MTIGDIKSAYISSDGYSAYITVEGLSTGGAYDFGLGLYNNPDNLKIVFSLTFEGYNALGVLETKSRTVYGVPCERPSATGAMRKAYPNQASPDETVSGSDVVIRVALSEFIYNDDTNITLSVASGWYTQGGTPSNAASSLFVTNNSTLDYPRVVGNWAIPQCQLIVDTSVHLEFLVFHKFAEAGKPVACVKFTITDGTNTVTQTVTSMSISSDSPLAKIIVYQDDIDVSSLNSGVCAAKAVAYPWVGDADSILNTDDGVNTFPTPLYTNLTFRLDKTGTHGHTCVDVTSGNDSTGAVYSSQSAAEAGSAYKTIAAALTALAAYHNTNSGHNDAGGGMIYLKAGTHTLNSTNGGTVGVWVTITRASNVAKADAILQAPATNANIPTRLKISGITVNGANSWYGGSSPYTKSMYLHDCAVAVTGSMTFYRSLYSVCHNCTGAVKNLSYYSSYPSCWALVRGNNFSVRHRNVPYMTIGNINVDPSYEISADAQIHNDGGVFAYNRFGDTTISQSVEIAQTRNFTRGFAFIQNIGVRYGDTTEPLAKFAGDSNSTTSNHIIIHHNTFAGARCNTGYNDTDIDAHYHLNWSVKNNIYAVVPNKDDTFLRPGTNAGWAAAIGAWPIGYRVGWSGNLSFGKVTINGEIGQEWNGEFWGLYSRMGYEGSLLNPAFVQDNTSFGANTSGGDYHLQSSSPAIGLAHDLVLPYDFEGNARTADNASGVYRYGSTVTYDGILKRYNGSSWVKSKLKRFNGADFVDANLKFYDGTWKTVDTTGM